MDDLISRQQAIDALKSRKTAEQSSTGIMRNAVVDFCIGIVKKLPSVQPEQTKMIKEIREWINSGNRGSADYFIVDKIEEILNKYE